MKLKVIFESNYRPIILNLLQDYKDSVYVEFPPYHLSISMGVHHWRSEVTQDIISYSWIKKYGDIPLSERHQLRLDLTKEIRIVITVWADAPPKQSFEALGLNFDKPTEPQFHADDQFTDERSIPKRLIISASGVSLGDEPVTWWPQEVIEILIEFRQGVIEAISEHLEYEYSQKRDFWSK